MLIAANSFIIKTQFHKIEEAINRERTIRLVAFAIISKSIHLTQFPLPGCECYCNTAPIPFAGGASIPRSRPRQLSSAP